MSIANNFPTISPSLSLDFANTKTLDPRVTFTRASTATYYDGKTTVLAEQNLLTYSQEFDNAAWVKSNASITANAVAAPDGASTADLVYPNTSGPYSSVYQAASGQCVSVYAKPSGKSFMRVQDGGVAAAWFNLLTGAVATVTAGYTASIAASTNGFYRCVVVKNSGNFPYGEFGPCDADASTSITANGTDGIYLWGAQLEQRSSVTAYTPTTDQPITRYQPVLQTAAAGVPRFDHNPTTGESLGLLIEEQRTNLLTYSSEFDNAAWGKTYATVATNVIIAPDGTLTGDKLFQDTTNAFHLINRSAGAAGSNTISIFAKKGESQYLWIGKQFAGGSLFNLNTGVVTSGTGVVQSVGNGWYRCSWTFTDAGTIEIGIPRSDGVWTGFSGDGYSGIYIWGAQLEDASFPTSYIKTEASQVTRSADAASMTGTNFSSWYNAGEGTVYAQHIPMVTYSYSSSGAVEIDNSAALQTTNIVVAISGTLTVNTLYKSAVTYQLGTTPYATRNGSSSPALADNPQNANRLRIAVGLAYYRQNTWIAKIAYYPKRLTNAELQGLTS